MYPGLRLIVVMCIIGTLIFLYLLPWYIAKRRQHHNKLPILLVNLFLGWTFIGWFAALVWACTSPPPARTA